MSSEIQTKLDELKLKGWTLASIAREIGQSSRAVESWNQGVRNPANLQPVLMSLDKLIEYKRIPKRKLYQKGGRKKTTENNKTFQDIRNEPI
jgi:transcriptional regulator with XRE-family HTH domain